MTRTIRARLFRIADNRAFQLYACAALMAGCIVSPVAAYLIYKGF